MSSSLLGLIFLPLGILLMCCAAVWQLYVVLSESHTLNRFQDKKLVMAVAAMFFSFSLAVYLLCPNARKKGMIFLLLGLGGAILYFLGKSWLPWQ